MSTGKRKTRKMRGQKWHGYGSKKKHRGGGSKGGKGYGGSHKHKYSYITRYEPDHYGYKGFYSMKKKDVAINLDDVQKIAEKSKKKEIDLAKMGFTKLLSRGEIKEALTIKIKKSSSAAKEKIEAAGGTLILEEKKDKEEKPEKKDKEK
jgi:large subunit ribosomal protein L15